MRIDEYTRNEIYGLVGLLLLVISAVILATGFGG